MDVVLNSELDRLIEDHEMTLKAIQNNIKKPSYQDELWMENIRGRIAGYQIAKSYLFK